MTPAIVCVAAVDAAWWGVALVASGGIVEPDFNGGLRGETVGWNCGTDSVTDEEYAMAATQVDTRSQASSIERIRCYDAWPFNHGKPISTTAILDTGANSTYVIHRDLCGD